MSNRNTVPKQLKPFVKNDPRINRNGRPKSFDALRALAQEIAHEKVKVGGDTVVIDGHAVTVAEAILRQWAQSKNPQLQQRFIEVAFGKVPNAVEIKAEVSGPADTPIPIRLIDYRVGITETEE